MDEAPTSVLVVGAGVSGLAAAAELSEAFPTTVIDRLPVVGGIATGYENESVKSLKRRCDASGARFVLGTTALRWSPERRLLIAGPAGIEWLPGRHLVYAGGTRPCTQAELRIVGDRLAGVVQATVAYHLLEIGVRLGERVVVVGTGDWAKRVGHLLEEQDCYTCVVPTGGESDRPDFGDEWWPGWVPVKVRGDRRVREILLAKGDLQERILCDAVMLAGGARPMRNIDGAIFEEMSDSVTYIQLVAESTTIGQLAAHATELATQLVDGLGRETT